LIPELLDIIFRSASHLVDTRLGDFDDHLRSRLGTTAPDNLIWRMTSRDHHRHLVMTPGPMISHITREFSPSGLVQSKGFDAQDSDQPIADARTCSAIIRTPPLVSPLASRRQSDTAWQGVPGGT
jgi:hypothetical protein